MYAHTKPPSPLLQRLRWPLALAGSLLLTMLILTALSITQKLLPDTRSLLARLVPAAQAAPDRSPGIGAPNRAQHIAPTSSETRIEQPAPQAAERLLTEAPAAAGHVLAENRLTTSAPIGNSNAAANLPSALSDSQSTRMQPANSLVGQGNQRETCLEEPSPEFPVEAGDLGIRHGKVLARLTIAADGRVRGVNIVSAEPAGVFERSVRRAALRWRCNASPAEHPSLVPFEFNAPD